MKSIKIHWNPLKSIEIHWNLWTSAKIAMNCVWIVPFFFFCELFPEVTSLEMPLSGWGCLADMGLASRKNLHKVDGFCQDFKRFQEKTWRLDVEMFVLMNLDGFKGIFDDCWRLFMGFGEIGGNFDGIDGISMDLTNWHPIIQNLLYIYI